jgi:hypothetical protein
MTRRVYVQNIPVLAYVDGWVVVSDDTDSETTLNEELAKALLEKGYEPETQTLVVPNDVELDAKVIESGRWVFSIPLEKA